MECYDASLKTFIRSWWRCKRLGECEHLESLGPPLPASDQNPAACSPPLVDRPALSLSGPCPIPAQCQDPAFPSLLLQMWYHSEARGLHSTVYPKEVLKPYPRRCEGDLIWKCSLCRYHQVKKRPLQWASPIWLDPSKKRHRERHMQREDHVRTEAEIAAMSLQLSCQKLKQRVSIQQQKSLFGNSAGTAT